MSIFRNLLSCISTENFASAYVNNPLQAKNTFSNKTCIICHESVVTCLNNRSNKCYKYSSNLLGTPTKHEQSPGRQNIKTTQPETMTTICVSCTDAINNPLNDSEIHGLTSPSYRNSLTHPYDTDTTTVTMATDTLNGNHNSASTSLQCSKFLGRWIDYCPILWGQKASMGIKSSSAATEWITTAATATTTTTATSTAMTTTRLDTLHQSYIISQKTQQESQNETSEQNNEDNTNDYINSSTNEESIEECYIPEPVFNLFLHLAQKGVYAKDLFRRPGNMAQIKHILHRFASNHTIDWKDYNIHTVATVAKRVLVNIPNGLIGLKGENQLLHTALLTQQQQHDSIQVKTIRRTFQSTLGVSSTGVTSKSSSEPANNLHGKTEDCMNTATITSVQQSQLSGNDNGENQTVTECTKQSDQIVRRATVIANIQSDKEINISLLFSYGSIQQIYQLTPIDLQRVQVFQSILRDLTSAHRQLTIMIFGILHQLVFNAAFNTAIQYSQQQESDKNSDEFPKIPLLKLAEGVVKSVAGSMFHTCTSSILLIDQTTQVLQSLVLCFPVVDKEFTQFYWDVLNNRYKLRKSKQTGRGATKINISKSVYSKSPCSARFINAAGRLFCFTNAIDATATANNNKNSSNNMLLSSPTSISSSLKHFCFPLKDLSQLQKNRQSSQIYRESSIESSLYQNVSKAVEDQDKIMESIVVQPVQSIASSVHASDLTTIEKNDVKYSSYAKADVHETSKLLTDGMNTASYSTGTNLRRNQSRYRSLRRRQMENLTRRAEWFLRPTTLPSLSFTPDGLKHLHENISVYDTHSQTAMSTISLLEMHRNMKDQLTTDIYVNSDLVQVVSPRILFTSSTSDLIQSNFSVQQTDPRVTLSVNEDCRTKLCPSLSPVYGHSFSSLINSPSPQFFVVSQSNNLFQHSTKYKDCEPNTSGYEQSVTTHSFLIPTALPINSSVDPLIYHHIPMHSLSHDRTEVSKLTALSGPDLLQSTSYESFPALTYSTLLHCMHSDLEEKTNKRENHTSNNNNKRVNNDDMTSNVPGDPSVITHDDIDDGQCELFSTAVKSPTICLGITSKSDMRSSDWSIDQPVLSENLHRRRSSALTTLYIPKK